MAEIKIYNKGIKDVRIYVSFMIHFSIIIIVSLFTKIDLLYNHMFLVNLNIIIFGFTLTTVMIINSIRKRTIELIKKRLDNSIKKEASKIRYIEYKSRILTIIGSGFLAILLSGFNNYDSWIYTILSTLTMVVPFSVINVFVIDLFDHILIEDAID